MLEETVEPWKSLGCLSHFLESFKSFILWRMLHLRHVWQIAQGQAEFFLEKLHGMAEKQVIQFLDGSVAPDGWGKFRETLIGLTDVTRSHFDKLVTVSSSCIASGHT